MDEEKLIKKLEGIERPDLSSATHQRQLKLVLVSAQRSSWIGILLVALPCLFLFGVILKYGFGVGSHLFSALEEKMADIDRSFFRFVPPLLLVGGPLIALALNLLAILHFSRRAIPSGASGHGQIENHQPADHRDLPFDTGDDFHVPRRRKRSTFSLRR